MTFRGLPCTEGSIDKKSPLFVENDDTLPPLRSNEILIFSSSFVDDAALCIFFCVESCKYMFRETMIHQLLLSFCVALLISGSMADGESLHSLPVTNRSRACVAPHAHYPFCNTSLSLAARVWDLIGRIRDADKPGLLTARGWRQGNLTALDYLGVPGHDWGLNCVHGVQSTCIGDVCPTSFPNPNALGASWNMSNVHEMGRVIGMEARALWLAGAREPSSWSGMAHIGLDCWSPNININRDPRWGRNQEVPTEDPLLGGDYSAAYTAGMQRNNAIDPRYLQAITTIKHWAAYSLDDADGFTRYDFDPNVSMYNLVDTYFPVFHSAVLRSDAKGVMCSYNALNGVPTCASPFLRHVLRDVWGFDGYVTSDTDSVECIYANHHFTKTAPEAVCVALRDGWTDINSGGTYFTYLAAALNASLCNMSDVDGALFRSLRLRFELGLFDPVESQPFWKLPLSTVHSKSSVAHSLFAAEQSIVLLKNDDHTLPLQNLSSTGSRRKLAIIGPSGNNSGVLLGNYLGWLCPGGMNDFSCVANIAETVKSLGNEFGWDVAVAEGCQHNAASPAMLHAALALANTSDVILLAVGLDESLEAEMLDRTSISLPDAQKALVAAIAAANPNKPIILLLINGGVVAIEDEVPLVSAVLEGWYPGMYGAQAIANTVFGLSNPGGKLPVTMYFSNYTSQMNMSEMSMIAGVGRSYKYLAVPALYPFGFGLSYSTFNTTCSFEASKNSSSDSNAKLVGTVSCGITIVAGEAAGDETAQLYLVPYPIPAPNPPVRPLKQLIHYERIHVSKAAGPSTVVFAVTEADFCLVDEKGQRHVMPATYGLQVTTDGGETVAAQFSIFVDTGNSNPCAQLV